MNKWVLLGTAWAAVSGAIGFAANLLAFGEHAEACSNLAELLFIGGIGYIVAVVVGYFVYVITTIALNRRSWRQEASLYESVLGGRGIARGIGDQEFHRIHVQITEALDGFKKIMEARTDSEVTAGVLLFSPPAEREGTLSLFAIARDSDTPMRKMRQDRADALKPFGSIPWHGAAINLISADVDAEDISSMILEKRRHGIESEAAILAVLRAPGNEIVGLLEFTSNTSGAFKKERDLHLAELYAAVTTEIVEGIRTSLSPNPQTAESYPDV